MSKAIRQIHRVLSIVFTAAVVANLVVMGQEPLALWVGTATLLPLLLLLATGLWLFVLPYAAKRRRGEDLTHREAEG